MVQGGRALLSGSIALNDPPPGLAERLRQRTHNSRKAGSTPAPWISPWIETKALPALRDEASLFLEFEQRRIEGIRNILGAHDNVAFALLLHQV
jgi:hypothetical protein